MPADAGHGVVALGEGAGLVEEHGVDRAHPFQGEAVLHQDAGLGPTIAVERAMTSGMARPRAWGQAITSTVTVLRDRVVHIAQAPPTRRR